MIRTHRVANPYEQSKYAATLDALPTTRFASAFEVNCSIGMLTRLLAIRCARLLAADVAEAALAQARRVAPALSMSRWNDCRCQMTGRTGALI